MSLKHTALVLAAMTAMAGPALAAPAEVADAIRADKPLGSGKYGFLVVTAYTATLWSDAPKWSMDAPFALTLQYGLSFTTEELVSRTLEEMKKVNPALGDGELKAYGEKLNAAFPAVRPGDTITALHVPGKPALFFRNGKQTAAMEEDRLNADFFGIWLSPKTSSPSLRRKLLGAQ